MISHCYSVWSERKPLVLPELQPGKDNSIETSSELNDIVTKDVTITNCEDLNSCGSPQPQYDRNHFQKRQENTTK
eukprot:6474750-Amphidinium_carterae.3